MVFFEDECINCGECVKLCQYGALDNGLIAERSICNNCHKREDAFACTLKCYPESRKIDSEYMTVKDVTDVVKRDMDFYQRSGGGVTISGGEPFAQPDFLYALLITLQKNQIHTAIETCGQGLQKDYERIAPHLDFVFMDLKSANNDKHEEWTGAKNETILNNIVRMDKLAKELEFDLLIRTPVIPGFNDTVEDIKAIGKFVSENCENYNGMELLPYHRLGRGKYKSLGREYELADLEVPSDGHMKELNKVLFDMGIDLYEF